MLYVNVPEKYATAPGISIQDNSPAWETANNTLI